MTQCVYFVRPVGMDGPIKIGCSTMPEFRVRALMAWCPFELEIIARAPGGRHLEANIHDCFAPEHTHSEWFTATPELLAFVEKVAAGVPVHKAIDLNNRRGNIRSRRAIREAA